jgi:hypothetical protein
MRVAKEKDMPMLLKKSHGRRYKVDRLVSSVDIHVMLRGEAVKQKASYSGDSNANPPPVIGIQPRTPRRDN